jgi:hypothetical protein
VFLIAVMVHPPLLVHHANPVLEGSGNRLDMVVLGLGNIDDDIGVEQRRG